MGIRSEPRRRRGKIAVGLAYQALVIARGQQQFDDHPAGRHHPGRLGLDHHPRGRRRGSGGEQGAGPVYLDHADAAGSGRNGAL